MTKKLVFLGCAIATIACGESSFSFQTHYISLGEKDTSVAITADATGNIFIVSRIVDSTNNYSIRATKTDAHGNPVAMLDFGDGISATAAALDPQGNLLVVGDSSAFPSFVADAIVAGNVYIAKLDNAITRVVATASLGNSATGATWAAGVTTDASGHVYVAGGSVAADFPTTPGSYEPNPPHSIPGDPPNAPIYGYIAEFSSDLRTIMHATLYGAPTPDCDLCYPPPSHIAETEISGIAIDPTGLIVIAGRSNAGVTGGAFVAKLSADLSSVKAQTAPPFSRVNSLAVDAQGNVFVTGWANSGMPFSSSAVQPTLPSTYYPNAGIVAKLAAVPFMNLVWGSYFGSANFDAIAIDAQGNIWITGSSIGNMLPDSPASSSGQYVPFVAELTPDGSALLNLVASQFGGTDIKSLPGGGVAVLGPADSFLLTGTPDQPSFLTVANSANNVSSGTIAPGELISLYGAGIGPSSPLDGQIVDGVFANRLGGYQVLFNGSPAPILYAGPNQLNTVAPKELAGEQTASINVVGPQRSTMFPTLFIAPSRPQIFSQIDSSGAYHAVVLNSDGTPNSASNPAKPGSVLTTWVSGAGLSNDQPVDGTIVQGPGSPIALPVSLLPYPSYNDLPLKITYAGNPPGVIAGLIQINLLYSTSGFAGYLSFQIQVGESVTTPATIAVAAN